MIILTLKVKIDGEETILTYDKWQDGKGFLYSSSDSRVHAFPNMLLKGNQLQVNGRNYEVLL